MQEASGLIQDSSTLGHHATTSVGTAVYQDPSPITSDPSDYSIHFSADSFSIPDHADLTFGDTLTVEAWAGRDDAILRAICARGSGSLTLAVETDHKVSAYRADFGLIVSSTVGISTTSWNHIVYTKSGATSKIYIDGVDRTGTVTDKTLTSPSVPLIVGADYNGTSIQWNGSLDEVAFYSTALGADRVLAHYNAATSSGGPKIRTVRSNLRW